MRRIQNLHLADKSVFMQYKQLFPINITSAQSLLEESQLATKQYRAIDMNGDTAAISEIENYYWNNVPKKLNDLLTQYNIDIFALEYVGEYDSTKTYYTNNLVTYEWIVQEGSLVFRDKALYYCKIPKETSITGVVPTDTTSWLFLGLQGHENEIPGVGFKIRGEWISGETYERLDAVSYHNSLFVANKQTTAIPTDVNDWNCLSMYNQVKIHTSEDNLIVGDIYWEIFGDNYEPFLTSTNDPLQTSDSKDFYVLKD